MCDADSEDRKQLKSLKKKLSDTLYALEGSAGIVAILFWRAGGNLEDETARLNPRTLHQYGRGAKRAGSEAQYFFSRFVIEPQISVSRRPRSDCGSLPGCAPHGRRQEFWTCRARQAPEQLDAASNRRLAWHRVREIKKTLRLLPLYGCHV